MTAIPPKLDALDPWAEALVGQAMADRNVDLANYAREVRGDDARYVVLLTHRDTPAGMLGSAPGKPNYEIELDRAAKSLTRVSIAR